MRGRAFLFSAVFGLLASAGTWISTAAAQSSAPVSTVSLEASTPYRPHPPNGGTDDYHCTLVNPHMKQNAFIVSSQFFPNSKEVHHAILF